MVIPFIFGSHLWAFSSPTPSLVALLPLGAGSRGIGVNGTHPSGAMGSRGTAAHVVMKHEGVYISTTLRPPTPVNMNTTSHHK